MRTALLIADSAQPLADGKMMAVGLYTDRVLQMAIEDGIEPTAEVPFGMATLSLVLTVMDLDPGEYEIQLALKAPGGKDYPAKQLPMRPFTIHPGGSANIVMNFAPFVVPTFGRYELVSSVAGEKTTESFEIRRVAPASLPNLVAQQLAAATIRSNPPGKRAKTGRR